MNEDICMHENIFIMDHPLIQHKITMLRDKATTASFLTSWMRG